MSELVPQPFVSSLPVDGLSAGTSPTLLALEDVHTYIAGSHILQGVTFDVTAGETTVLIGRNGAGKSTTLRTIMGILSPAKGSIVLGGEELSGKPSHLVARQGVGYVPEDRDVFASLTVEENLTLAQRSGASRGTAGIAQAYALFPDLRGPRGRSASAMSGGQQQMLAIARALVNRNRVVLVDEPTKGLAPVIVKQLAAIFQSLRDEGETILLVEQNLEFAQAVGHRYFVLDDGRIVHGGRMDELRSEPEYLRRYIGV
ncbi:MAG: ABC transporter ATP-binding protein [Chloroflexota bacterium]|nr:ABC transporter ATP-binding protein [Chloroflexota bacterium]